MVFLWVSDSYITCYATIQFLVRSACFIGLIDIAYLNQFSDMLSHTALLRQCTRWMLSWLSWITFVFNTLWCNLSSLTKLWCCILWKKNTGQLSLFDLCQIDVTASVLIDSKITSCNIHGCSSILRIMLFTTSILRDQQSSLGKVSLHNVIICATIFLVEPFISHNCKCEHSTISSLTTSDFAPASIDGVWLYCGFTKLLWMLLDVTPAIYV